MGEGSSSFAALISHGGVAGLRYTVLAARPRYRIQKRRFIVAVELDRGRALTDALPMQVGDGQRALIDGGEGEHILRQPRFSNPHSDE